jgi:FkbM family methyltransferase
MTDPFYETAEFYRIGSAGLARQEIEPYAHLLKDHRTITLFDCGANRGCWTRAAFETFPNAVVHSHIFEPSARNHAFMTDRHHGLIFTPAQQANIAVNRTAVGDTAGELELYADWDGSWLGSLIKRPDIRTTQSETVPVITIDQYAEEHGIGQIDILKLDVEGWELHALKGAQRLLNAGAVKLVLFEFSSINVFSRTFFHDFWSMLTPLGFEFFFLSEDASLTPVTHYDGRWEQFAGTVVYIARHTSLPGPLPLPIPVQAAQAPDRSWRNALGLKRKSA